MSRRVVPEVRAKEVQREVQPPRWQCEKCPGEDWHHTQGDPTAALLRHWADNHPTAQATQTGAAR